MADLIKIKKSEISAQLKDGYDMFICSSSFDDRCLSIPNLICKKQISEVIICHFEDTYECANTNYEKINNIFSSNANVDTIDLKKHDPIANFDLLCTVFSALDLQESSCILIDVSTFTREFLLILLRFIKLNLNPSIKVTLCYSPSSTYPKWLSRGVKEIRSILGYSGDFSTLKKPMLIVMAGFEYERSQVVIDNYEPAKLFLGKATSKNSISGDLAEINDSHYKNLVRQNTQAEEFEFSCIDIEKTKNIILGIAKEYQNDYNIIVAPMNNKISTLGVAYAALENSSIQICYASTNQYNIEERHGESDYAYCFDLFDSVKS